MLKVKLLEGGDKLGVFKKHIRLFYKESLSHAGI